VMANQIWGQLWNPEFRNCPRDKALIKQVCMQNTESGTRQVQLKLAFKARTSGVLRLGATDEEGKRNWLRWLT
jgi:hypothetical protein